jgi:hypothetical protein
MKLGGRSSCYSSGSLHASTPQQHRVSCLQQARSSGDNMVQSGLGGSSSGLHNKSAASPLKVPRMYSSRSVAAFNFDFRIAAAARAAIRLRSACLTCASHWARWNEASSVASLSGGTPIALDDVPCGRCTHIRGRHRHKDSIQMRAREINSAGIQQHHSTIKGAPKIQGQASIHYNHRKFIIITYSTGTLGVTDFLARAADFLARAAATLAALACSNLARLCAKG